MIRPIATRFDLNQRRTPSWGGAQWKGPKLFESLMAEHPNLWAGVRTEQFEPPTLEQCLETQRKEEPRPSHPADSTPA